MVEDRIGLGSKLKDHYIIAAPAGALKPIRAHTLQLFHCQVSQIRHSGAHPKDSMGEKA